MSRRARGVEKKRRGRLAVGGITFFGYRLSCGRVFAAIDSVALRADVPQPRGQTWDFLGPWQLVTHRRKRSSSFSPHGRVLLSARLSRCRHRGRAPARRRGWLVVIDVACSRWVREGPKAA